MKEANDSGLEARASELEPKYRSEGEARIGRLLDRYGLPFFYEQPTLIYDRGKYEIWHPAFTLPGANGTVIEYSGATNASQAVDDIRHKQNVYRDNGIQTLVVAPSDLEGEQWAEQLYARIGETSRYALTNRPGYAQRNVDGYHG